MSNELRTPLNHIIGFTDLLVSKNFGGLTQVQEEYLNDVLTSSRHLLSLLNDILDISKVEAGKLELDLSDVAMKSLLQNSLNVIKEKAEKSRIKCNIDIDGIPQTIRADERKLKQILYNLLSNAVKFTPQGGSIGLSARRLSPQNGFYTDLLADDTQRKVNPKDWIEISVIDTGIGLKGTDLKTIFKPFEQVDQGKGRKFQGTGLGLSLYRKLVELHGGKIWAESEGESKGSTFRFVIPL